MWFIQVAVEYAVVVEEETVSIKCSSGSLKICNV